MELLQVPSELERMLALYRERKPRRVLEIGCWDGGTLRFWLEDVGENGKVVAVDLSHPNVDIYEQWRKPDTTLDVVYGYSQSASVVEQMRARAPYEWVFIDGDHDESAVRSDVDVCLPLVQSGGLLLMHDIARGILNDCDPGPQVVFAELATNYETDTFVEVPPPWNWAHGIGVVYVP